ncbi:hypothetical protein EBS80_01360, partial [bacterium]|nr:hypothetical protein [bacterium]
ASLRLVVSYHPIGFEGGGTSVHVDVAEGITTIQCGNTPADFLAHTIPNLVKQHSHRDDPLFVAIYAGLNGFVPALGALTEVTRIRPNTRFVVLTCTCISADQEERLSVLFGTRSVAAVGWCGCSGTREMHAICLALRGTPADEAIRLTPGLSPRNTNLRLGA